MRAFCEKNGDFRNFVLSTPTIEGPADSRIEDDQHWNRKITLKVIPDQRLSKEQRKVIEQDYGMTRGSLRVTTRAALAQYVLQALRIDPHVIHARAEGQQIVVEIWMRCGRGCLGSWPLEQGRERLEPKTKKAGHR